MPDNIDSLYIELGIDTSSLQQDRAIADQELTALVQNFVDKNRQIETNTSQMMRDFYRVPVEANRALQQANALLRQAMEERLSILRAAVAQEAQLYPSRSEPLRQIRGTLPPSTNLGRPARRDTGSETEQPRNPALAVASLVDRRNSPMAVTGQETPIPAANIPSQPNILDQASHPKTNHDFDQLVAQLRGSQSALSSTLLPPHQTDPVVNQRDLFTPNLPQNSPSIPPNSADIPRASFGASDQEAIQTTTPIAFSSSAPTTPAKDIPSAPNYSSELSALQTQITEGDTQKLSRLSAIEQKLNPIPRRLDTETDHPISTRQFNALQTQINRINTQKQRIWSEINPEFPQAQASTPPNPGTFTASKPDLPTAIAGPIPDTIIVNSPQLDSLKTQIEGDDLQKITQLSDIKQNLNAILTTTQSRPPFIAAGTDQIRNSDALPVARLSDIEPNAPPIRTPTEQPPEDWRSQILTFSDHQPTTKPSSIDPIQIPTSLRTEVNPFEASPPTASPQFNYSPTQFTPDTLQNPSNTSVLEQTLNTILATAQSSYLTQQTGLQNLLSQYRATISSPSQENRDFRLTPSPLDYSGDIHKTISTLDITPNMASFYDGDPNRYTPFLSTLSWMDWRNMEQDRVPSSQPNKQFYNADNRSNTNQVFNITIYADSVDQASISSLGEPEIYSNYSTFYSGGQ